MKSDDVTDSIDQLRVEQLRALPPPVQDPTAANRSLRRARAVFLQQHDLANLPLPDRFWHLYVRAEPLLAASLGIVYLGWAIDTLSSLWR
jgi:hypothetical protein